jgi:hypothetical protein
MKLKPFLLSALLSLLGLACPQSARAQFIGDVGLQTLGQSFVTNTCSGAPQFYNVANIGAIAHQASALSTAASFSMEIDAQDSIATYRISNPQVSFANILSGAGEVSYIVQASGYYPKVLVSVTCSPGALYSVTYSGAQAAFNALVGAPGGSVTNLNGSLSNVQGIVSQQQSAGAVDPIILGGLQLPINQNFLTAGIDNFNVSSAGIPAGSAGTFTIDTVPTPTTSGEFAVVFEANLSDGGAGTSIVAPWTCAPSLPGACGGGSPQMSMAYLGNVSAGQKFQRTFTNSTPAGQDIGAIVLFSSPASAIRQTNLASGTGVLAFSSNTLANSTKVIGIRCGGTTPCIVSGVTDTQGGTWSQVTGLTFNNGNQASGIYVWASQTLSTAAADTVTATVSSGTIAGTMVAEITGTTTSSLTQPSVSLQAGPTGNLIITQDAQFPNQFVCNVAISTATTTQCQAPPTTINGVAVRAYVTDIQVNTTTTGTASAVQLVTGTGSNCGTGTANLSAITYSTVTAAAPTLASFLGMRTPLFAPLQSAVCVKQTGTPGTAVVEVHGFFAP